MPVIYQNKSYDNITWLIKIQQKDLDIYSEQTWKHLVNVINNIYQDIKLNKYNQIGKRNTFAVNLYICAYEFGLDESDLLKSLDQFISNDERTDLKDRLDKIKPYLDRWHKRPFVYLIDKCVWEQPPKDKNDLLIDLVFSD